MGVQSVKYYKGTWKYRLLQPETYQTRIDVHNTALVSTQFIELMPTGSLTIKPGYCWDGPSGPTIDRFPLVPENS